VRFVFFVILIDKRAKWSKYGYHPQFSVYCKFNFDVFLSIPYEISFLHCLSRCALAFVVIEIKTVKGNKKEPTPKL
jgi:hypothetical protein